jgi:hypothetical protein
MAASRACEDQFVQFDRVGGFAFLDDLLRGLDAGFYGDVHIIIAEHTASACNVEVAKASQVVKKRISMFSVSDFEERVGFRHPHDQAVKDLLSGDKAEPDKVPDGEVREPVMSYSDIMAEANSD